MNQRAALLCTPKYATARVVRCVLVACCIPGADTSFWLSIVHDVIQERYSDTYSARIKESPASMSCVS